MKHLFFWGVVLQLAIVCPAQTLKVGDHLPLGRVFSNSYSHFHSSSPPAWSGKKLIVLDFWSHRCKACLQSFSRLDSLQEEFKDQVQFVLVNEEGKDSTERFFLRRPNLPRPRVAYISGDSTLTSKFHHTSVPYYVWLNDSGRILQTTEHDGSGRLQIQAYLKSNAFMGIEYASKYVVSLFDPTQQEHLRSYSYLALFDGKTFLKEISDSLMKVRSYYNRSVKDLLIEAFDEGGKWGYRDPGRTRVCVNEIQKIEKPADKDKRKHWAKENAYTYQLRIPRRIDFYTAMRQDMQRYFPYQCTIRKEPVTCLILKQFGSIDLIRSRGGPTEDKFYYAAPYSARRDSLRYVRNQPFEDFSLGLRDYIQNHFNSCFVDETNIQENVDISIPAPAIDRLELEQLNLALHKYGLRLIKEQRLLDVLVITE